MVIDGEAGTILEGGLQSFRFSQLMVAFPVSLRRLCGEGSATPHWRGLAWLGLNIWAPLVAVVNGVLHFTVPFCSLNANPWTRPFLPIWLRLSMSNDEASCYYCRLNYAISSTIILFQKVSTCSLRMVESAHLHVSSLPRTETLMALNAGQKEPNRTQTPCGRVVCCQHGIIIGVVKK